VPIRMGLTVERLAQRDGIVSAVFSDGTSGAYDLVVGADGIQSAVRRLTLEPTAVPRPVGQVGWRFLAPRPAEVTTWSVMLGRRAAFLTLPLDCERDDRSGWRRESLLHEMCVTPALIESAPVSIVRDLVSIGIADRGVRSSND
jgi:2-polyprenyl-6-methoxyphenol hydroxylase-like FAD-dependent oxidoreductase